MMKDYAEKTQVPVGKTQEEIQSLLRNYGATGFMFGEESGMAFFCFRTESRFVKMTSVLPDRKSKEFTHTPIRQTRRKDREVQELYDQAVRQRWRSLLLRIKGRIEEVKYGHATFDEAFLPYLMLPNGQTMMQWAKEEIPRVYAIGEMPKLLPGAEDDR